MDGPILPHIMEAAATWVEASAFMACVPRYGSPFGRADLTCLLDIM